jgi:hypothetical protein
VTWNLPIGTVSAERQDALRVSESDGREPVTEHRLDTSGRDGLPPGPFLCHAAVIPGTCTFTYRVACIGYTPSLPVSQ